MSNVDKVKQVILDNIDCGDCGLFDCRNWVGDPMETIYSDDEVTVDICYGWAYFEVFGLSKDEFEELHDWYDQQVYLHRTGELV